MPIFELTSAGGGGGSNLIRQVTTVIHNTDILTLPSAFVEVVPSPGSGLVLIPVTATFVLDATAGAYTNLDADRFLILSYNDDFLHASNGIPLPQATADIHMGSVIFAQRVGDATYPTQAFGLEDTPATFDGGNIKVIGINPLGNFADGNEANTLTITVAYFVLDLATGRFIPA